MVNEKLPIGEEVVACITGPDGKKRIISNRRGTRWPNIKNELKRIFKRHR